MASDQAVDMQITIDGHPIALLPRITAAILLLIEHQREIEQKQVGQITLDFAPSQVVLSLREKLSVRKVESSLI